MGLPRSLRAAGELRDIVEEYLGSVSLAPELGALELAVRYALESGGKRIRPVLCLAVADAAGGSVHDALPAARAVELVHKFSLVHDDLPALDDADERRGRPSAHVAFGEGVAVLAGDALLVEAFRLVLFYDTPEPARELARATLGMIGGQHRDISGEDVDLTELHGLKTGRLFAASVGLGLWAASVPESEQAPWRAFGDEVGQLFQLVDDILDGDGVVARDGPESARELADQAAKRAHEQLAGIAADTSVLAELVDGLTVRTA
jgi:geranylgeranyl diphosphate synthase type II